MPSATGCSREYSSSLSELVASRSNMNKISLNRNSFIRGEVQFLRGRKIMFLPAKEAVNWAAGWGVSARRHTPSVGEDSYACMSWG